MASKLILANWKMNGNLADNEKLLSSFVTPNGFTATGCDVGICVPFPYLFQCQQILAHSKIMLGAQNLSEYEQGAYTGEVSAGMLKDFGCAYVLVGHSERRTLQAESNTQVIQKALAAWRIGIEPIICVGETLLQRQQQQVEQVISEQLLGLKDLKKVTNQYVIAYEPIWAIGSGQIPNLSEIEKVHQFIRLWIKDNCGQDFLVKVLYGGSVKSDNAGSLLDSSQIDGLLVGGASLDVEQFGKIISAYNKQV